MDSDDSDNDAKNENLNTLNTVHLASIVALALLIQFLCLNPFKISFPPFIIVIMGLLSVVSSVTSGGISPISPLSPSYVTGYTPVAWYKFSLRTYVLVLLPLLSLLGAFGTMVLGGSNGTFESITALIASETSEFPGLDAFLLRKYTGVKFVDQQLTMLVTFFAPVLDTNHAALTLFTIAGFGQFGAVWTLMMMESMRMGNKGKAVSYIGTVGFILQNISFTITTPLWLFLHLLTSPVSKPFPGTHANSVLLISTWDLRILPVSIILGYIVPSILMALPSPDVVTPEAHQRFIAFWQPFPIWTVLIHQFLKHTLTFAAEKLTSKDNKARAQTPLGTSYLSNAKHVYRLVLALCILTHIPVLLITLLPSTIFSTSLPYLSKLGQENITSVFIPHIPLLTYRISSLSEGVHNCLIWDLYVGSTALLLWAVLLYRNATTEKAIVDPNTSLPIYRELLLGERGQDGMLRRKLIWKIGVWSVVGGPIGALAVLLWERDEIVRQKIKQGI